MKLTRSRISVVLVPMLEAVPCVVPGVMPRSDGGNILIACMNNHMTGLPSLILSQQTVRVMSVSDRSFQHPLHVLGRLLQRLLKKYYSSLWANSSIKNWLDRIPDVRTFAASKLRTKSTHCDSKVACSLLQSTDNHPA